MSIAYNLQSGCFGLSKKDNFDDRGVDYLGLYDFKFLGIMSLNRMRNIFVGVVFIVITLVLFILYLKQSSQKPQKVQFTNLEIGMRYVAIGDSYTIGLDVAEEDRWPNILTNHLKKEGINIHLVANPAVSGYTVKDVIKMELVEVEKIKPDFVTVLIGANDNFGQKDAETYRQELRKLLDKLQLIVTNPKNIVLITIPDYTKSPALKLYKKEDMLKLIEEYNEIIKEEGEKRDLTIANIFPMSQTMINDDDYVSDGLHPSAQGYIKWERIIFPVVFDLLKNK